FTSRRGLILFDLGRSRSASPERWGECGWDGRQIDRLSPLGDAADRLAELAQLAELLPEGELADRRERFVGEERRGSLGLRTGPEEVLQEELQVLSALR